MHFGERLDQLQSVADSDRTRRRRTHAANVARAIRHADWRSFLGGVGRKIGGRHVTFDDRCFAHRLDDSIRDGAWVNGGYFVLSPKVIDYIAGDSTTWEKEPMEQLANEGQMDAFHHHGFWQPMDTLRDKVLLEDLWESGKAPWKRWP
jgi:NDP-sugar pyrophosphorylase family protein